MEMNRIVTIAKLGLLALPVVLLLAGVLLASRTPDKKKGSPRRGLTKALVLAVVLALVYVGCFIGVRQMQSNLEGSITIGLNYAKASRGLNPNGTRFNTYDILSDEVLEKAIADGGMGNLTPRQLRAALSVEPLEAGGVSAERYYVATEYVLSYAATEKTQHLNGSAVVEAVANAYYDSFTAQYSRKTVVMEPDFGRVDEADYLDKVELLNKYAADIAGYLDMCGDDNMTYAYTDGETFSSLAAKVESLSKVELERLESYILVKGLSENLDQQLAKLSYLNLMKDISADKNSASYRIHLDAIEMYERDMATIVLIPTRDDEGEFYMSRTKVGVDVFADMAEDYSKDASNAKSYISTNNYAISQLIDSAATEADYATADAMVEAICTNLSAYAKRGLAMATDYDANTAGRQMTLSLSEYNPLSRCNLLKYAFLFVLMSVSGGIFLAALPERKQGKKQ